MLGLSFSRFLKNGRKWDVCGRRETKDGSSKEGNTKKRKLECCQHRSKRIKAVVRMAVKDCYIIIRTKNEYEGWISSHSHVNMELMMIVNILKTLAASVHSGESFNLVSLVIYRGHPYAIPHKTLMLVYIPEWQKLQWACLHFYRKGLHNCKCKRSTTIGRKTLPFIQKKKKKTMW